MADQDHQAAMELSRNISTNPRRASVAPPQRESLPRAAKRARTNGGLIPMTPQSMSPSTPSQTTDAANLTAESSPLSSISLSKHSFSFGDEYMKDQLDTPSEPEQTKPRKSRSKKRNSEEDDEFYPIHNAEDGSDTLKTPGEPIRKSKSTGKRKAGIRKVPGATYHVNTQLDKPEPHGQPDVWADKRQQLCETLPYYNAYQSGAYYNSGIVYGQLIDKEVDGRDKLDEQVVITSVGGGKSVDENGKAVRTKDLVKSPIAAAYMRTKELELPVAVIAGQGNKISPSKLPHYYNVLDWFHVTDVWPERAEGMITWKVRLEKIYLTEKSWWAVKGSSVLAQDSFDGRQKVKSQACSKCGQPSKIIYNAGWTCLSTECTAFFQFENGYEDASLDYSEEFVKERTPYQGPVPGPLSPPLLTDRDMAEMDAFGVEKAFKRGIVCPKCGCCSRRIAWDHWFCENSDCDFTYSLNQIPMPINEVIARTKDHEDDRSNMKSKEYEFARGGIRSSQKIHGQWDINEYKILGEAREVVGFVRHFKSNGIINNQKDGPNDLFLQMQTGEFNLRRNAARQEGFTGEILTSHWAANWGAPYKFGVRQISKGFDEAPVVILKAMKRLTWAGQVTVTDEFESFQPFNECLSIGYFEETKIGYHDDGEKELGPTVATLSLGAPAIMSFRPKAKSTIASITGKGKVKASAVKPAVLQLLLDHGDIMVMHGRKIQQLYEHAVTPKGPLRYALTCRYIRPEMMANEAEIQDAILKGTLPPGSDQYNYDGDLNAVAAVHSANEVDKFVNNITARLKTGDLTASQVREINERLATAVTPSSTDPEQGIEVPRDVTRPDAT